MTASSSGPQRASPEKASASRKLATGTYWPLRSSRKAAPIAASAQPASSVVLPQLVRPNQPHSASIGTTNVAHAGIASISPRETCARSAWSTLCVRPP